MNCPFCGHENIEGADTCAACEHALSDLKLPTPASEVEAALMRNRVADLEPKPPIVVESATSLRDVLNLLVEKRIGCVLVVEEGRLVGIFSERDALIRIGENSADWGDRPIGDFMTPNPQSLDGEAFVAFAVHAMDLGGYRHIPIVDGEGAASGVISVRDILGFLYNKMSLNA